MNILLLEDDIALNKAIKKVLELDYHIVETFTDGQILLDALDQSYDLYILDINVPHISGLELLDMILHQNDQAKVIMISSNTDEQSLQTAYDLGCVDYLKKPFHIAELRVKISRLKLSREHLSSTVKLKPDSDVLSKKEKRLLNLLLDNISLVVSYKMIENYVYENKPMTMDALRALVRRLRAKLLHDMIENVIDEGYTISKLPHTGDQRYTEGIRNKIEALEEENTVLKLEKEVLLKRSTTDALTDLYNRIKIQEIFLYEQQQFIDHGDELSVILMDLDDFKFINDTHGHNIGDKYLKHLSKTLTEFFRAVDIIGRWGGEEFIILLPKTSLLKAKSSALSLRDSIKDIDCPKLGSRTASFGLTTLMNADTLSSFVGRADDALLKAKANGKDRVEVTTPTLQRSITF
jgi:diguanylate cyclase (GGDEF)-like protein